ncbi:PREDICTED: interleukin-3 [Ceratotherium simum simum]|uniref:Interleukin-3 n=1 Tax=Ceratotherium simum simum TaxID=73337 RepID=A0ABM1DCL9_CERSS|nr:PREDICTED: interleukin-3 [Ceratotherium simum simum]
MNKSVVCYGGSMSDKDSSDARPSHPGCEPAAAAHKRQKPVSDTSEHHEGPRKNRMRPASPNMSSLPVLRLLLLLFAFYAPQAQGRPSPTSWHRLIEEIMDDLNKPPSPPQVSDSLDLNERQILLDETLLRPNLDAFLKAATNFQEKGSRIGKNLEELQSCLPTLMPTGDPIQIKEGNWGDFQRKLEKYLKTLDNFLSP